MELRKAIEDAGPHGKGKTSDGSWGFKVTLGEVAFYFNGALVDSLPMGLFDDDTWEVIPEERIEVNDIVNKPWCDVSTPEHACIVIGADESHCAIMHSAEITCACNVRKVDLTLIRKGKEHRFEVKAQRYVSDGLVFSGVAPMSSPEGKTYRMTLEEM